MPLKVNNNFIIWFLFIIFVLLSLSLTLSIIKSTIYEDNFFIDFNNKNFNNKNQILYIDENLDSGKFYSFGKINNSTYAEIADTPINFIFTPKEFPLQKAIEITSYFINDGPWEISLNCEQCGEELQYKWLPFYHKDLDNGYSLAKKFNNYYIYSKNNKKWKNENDIDFWIIKNIKPRESLSIVNYVYPLSKISNPDINYISGATTEINEVLRGGHSFYVYLSDSLNLEVTKKDLNWYVGQDDVTVSLYNDDNVLIFTKEMADDGIESINKDMTENEQEFKIIEKIKNSGVYLLEFSDKNIFKSDWTIEKIKINTNKIILTGKNNLILSGATLYTKTDKPKNLEINIWHRSALGEIAVINKKETKKILLEEKDINQWLSFNIEKGESEIKLNGDQRISGANFAFSKEAYFEPFMYDLSKKDDPDFIITDFYQRKEDAWTKVSRQFSYDEIKKLDNLKNIKFSLKSEKINQISEIETKITAKNFILQKNVNEYSIYGKTSLSDFTLTKNSSITNALNSLIPENKKIYFHTSAPLEELELLKINKTYNIDEADFIVAKDLFVEPVFIKQIDIKIK